MPASSRAYEAEEAVNDEAESFTRLIEPLFGSAFRLAIVMLEDRATAEDALQDASLKAWRSRRSLRDADALRPWFLKIVANECRMIRRQRWWSVLRTPHVAQRDDGEEAYSGESQDLRAALLRLRPDDRLPIVLHFYLDMPLDEVAAVLRLSPAAAKSRIYRALRRLRLGLLPQEVY